MPELPRWSSVLAVVAHPDDESFGLGAVLSTFVHAGATVSVLCLTRGEASTLHGVEGDLATIRAAELEAAARELGIADVALKDYPDGALEETDHAALVGEVTAAIDRVAADGLIVFDLDGVTGHPDHRHASAIALEVATARGLPVLGWTLPADVAETLHDEFGAPFTGHTEDEVDLVIEVDRAAQLRAVACHPSQAVPGSVLWRRLEILGDREYLRRLSNAVGSSRSM